MKDWNIIYNELKKIEKIFQNAKSDSCQFWWSCKERHLGVPIMITRLLYLPHATQEHIRFVLWAICGSLLHFLWQWKNRFTTVCVLSKNNLLICQLDNVQANQSSWSVTYCTALSVTFPLAIPLPLQLLHTLCKLIKKIVRLHVALRRR